MSTRKQIIAAAAAVGIFAVLMGGIKFLQIMRAIEANASFLPPPEAVTTAVVTELPWPRTLSSVGSIAPVEGVMLSAEEGGEVSRILFDSGSSVSAGEVVIELDASVELAELEAARANLALAKHDYDRAVRLAKDKVIAQADMDKRAAELKVAEANAQSLEARIARKRIVAPFSGRLGIRQVNVGTYVVPGTPIIPLQRLDTVYVNFSLPQRVAHLVSNEDSVTITLDGVPGEFTGKVTAIDPMVDESTRNLNLQATLPNPTERLRPGMFASVTVTLPEEDRFLTIPAAGVKFAPYGDTVFVVENMKNPAGAEYLGVREQIVKLGARRGDQIAVLSGLQAGERVVSSGAFKLRPGGAVTINDEIAPSSSADPKPADT